MYFGEWASQISVKNSIILPNKSFLVDQAYQLTKKLIFYPKIYQTYFYIWVYCTIIGLLSTNYLVVEYIHLHIPKENQYQIKLFLINYSRFAFYNSLRPCRILVNGNSWFLLVATKVIFNWISCLVSSDLIHSLCL